MIYCDNIHMVADSIEELHEFAEKIGLKKCWFEKAKKHPHYDFGKPPNFNFINKNRNAAIAAGAQVVSTRIIIEKSKKMINNQYDIIHDKVIEILHDENKSIDDLVKLMQEFNYELTNRGIIRTILVTLKPFRSQNAEFDKIYHQLTEILRKGSKNNIV